MFVFLADIVFFAEVDEEDDRFCGKEVQRVYNFDLCTTISRFQPKQQDRISSGRNVVVSELDFISTRPLREFVYETVHRAGIISSFIALVHHETRKSEIRESSNIPLLATNSLSVRLFHFEAMPESSRQ